MSGRHCCGAEMWAVTRILRGVSVGGLTGHEMGNGCLLLETKQPMNKARLPLRRDCAGLKPDLFPLHARLAPEQGRGPACHAVYHPEPRPCSGEG